MSIHRPKLARAALQRTNRLAAGIAVAFTLWSFALVPYGDAYTRSHVAFYMAITVISCIFCLMYLRSAAFIVALIVNGAFIAFFVSTAQPTFVAIAINLLLVCVGMMSIVLTNYRHFESMVVSKQRSDALSNENFRLANRDSLTGLGNAARSLPNWRSSLKKPAPLGNGLLWASWTSMASNPSTISTVTLGWRPSAGRGCQPLVPDAEGEHRVQTGRR